MEVSRVEQIIEKPELATGIEIRHLARLALLEQRRRHALFAIAGMIQPGLPAKGSGRGGLLVEVEKIITTSLADLFAAPAGDTASKTPRA